MHLKVIAHCQEKQFCSMSFLYRNLIFRLLYLYKVAQNSMLICRIDRVFIMGEMIVFVQHVTYLLQIILLCTCKISCPCCVPTYETLLML